MPLNQSDRRGSRAALTSILLAMSISGVASATDFPVTKTADTADGACNADCSLREAIIAANANAGPDSVTVPASMQPYVLTIAGANGEDAAANGDLDIAAGGLAINGAGAASTIIDGNDANRVFDVVGSGTVTFTGITVQNGLADFGGGIANNNSTAIVTISQCVIKDNNATSFGGGINNNGNGTINVLDSTVMGNTSGDQGGGINNNLNGPMTIDETIISGNTAQGFGGGGVNNNSGGTMTITESTINGGNTAENGGGINNNSGGSLSLTDTTVSGNSSTSSIGGGGILNNSSGSLTIVESTISGNTAAGPGGGIANNSSGALALTNSTVSNNTTTDTDGGGGIYKGSSGSVSLTNVTVIGNSAPTGGGLRNNNPNPPISLLRSIVANSVAGGSCSGAVTSLGNNLSNDGTCNLVAAGDIPAMNPQVEGLAPNGGLTETHELLSTSPALNAGGAGCPPPATDQRGIMRAQGAACEIGSFECAPTECGGIAPTATATPTLGPPTATPTIGPPTATATVTPTRTVTRTATATSTPGEGAPAIPTLSSTLLLLLGITLATAGYLVLRRR